MVAINFCCQQIFINILVQSVETFTICCVLSDGIELYTSFLS